MKTRKSSVRSAEVTAKTLFSINRAADLLERDRQTLVRALRHTPADGIERGQKRWFWKTIVAALAVPPQQRREIGRALDRYAIPSAKLAEMRAEYEERVEEIAAEPSPDRRRKLALKLAPALQAFQIAYLETGRRLRIAPDDVIGARAELVFQELMSEVAEAAQWPRHGDGFFLAMLQAMPSDDDGNEAA
jgi:hypothetical protein